MRVVFMGSADFSLPCLDALYHSEHELLAIVTQPDKPKGRGKNLGYTPVKEWAIKQHIPLLQPLKVNDPQSVAEIAALHADVFIVVAFGQILKQDLLQLTKFGCLNVHGSLLPAYRGAAPIHWAIRNGETETGVSIMQMDAGMDSGPILLQKSMMIGENETVGEVHDCMATLGAQALMEALTLLEKGKVKEQKQEQSLVTFAPLLKKEHEAICWQKDAVFLHNQIRGMSPWPGTYTVWQGERIKLYRSLLADTEKSYMPGQILKIDNQNGILVGTPKGALWLKEVQPAGKKKMHAAEFARGKRIQIGMQFDDISIA